MKILPTKKYSLFILIITLIFSAKSYCEIDNEEHQISEPFIADVAIIIDDLGYSKRQGLSAIELPGEITYAIIPHSPNAVFLAQQAQERRKELMLHAPMSNVHNFPMGQDGLSESMNENDFSHALNQAILSVPYIAGVNNHMGSLLTQKQLPMEWTMKTLSEHGLYFIDSRTTSHSVAWKTAQQRNVPSLKRDVFLDHDRNYKKIHQQFNKFISVAKKQGYAIAIAHPYPETLRYLQRNLSRLPAEKINLVSASTLVSRYSPNKKNIQAMNSKSAETTSQPKDNPSIFSENTFD